MVHGVGGDSGNWDGVVAALPPRFRAIRLDLSGHGRSGLIEAPCSVQDFARDVTDVMDALGVRAAAIAGFSLGGLIAQAIALESPSRVTKLALIATVAGRTPEEQARSAARIEMVREKGLAFIAAGNREFWFSDGFRRDHPEVVEARVRQFMACDPASYLHAFAVFARGDFVARLGEIRAPTLVLAGEFDPAATARMARLMHERIPGSRLEILAGMRHALLIECPQRVAAPMAVVL
ncbi:MAG TPA: alpha/beta fold hydrolase [Burkholderiales bacterium]|nr:alpha/beta fold hydrolase [Burkholderiales bacterium]